MPYDITDAKDDIQVLAAQVSYIMKCLEGLDKMVVKGGKPSVMEAAKGELEQEEQKEEQKEEPEEGTVKGPEWEEDDEGEPKVETRKPKKKGKGFAAL